MAKMDRKKFISIFASSAAGIFLSFFLFRMHSGNPFGPPPIGAALENGISPDGSRSDKAEIKPATPRPEQSVVTIAGSGLSGDTGIAVEKAIELAGGFGFIKKGSTVLLKPNFNTGDAHPASTNPEVIRHVIRLVKKQNPYAILIGDRSSFWTSTIKCIKENGAYAIAEQEGAEVYPFEDGRWEKINPKSAKSWPKGFKIPAILNQVDYVINIPAIKTHSIALFTMAIKNWVGILEPLQRTTDLHLFNSSKETFGHMLAELHLARLPDFVVMDGTRAFVEGGPTTGKVVEPNLIIASKDIVANDAAGLAVLKTLGTIPEIQDNSIWSQPQIARAAELGFGATGAGSIRIRAENVKGIDRIISNLY